MTLNYVRDLIARTYFMSMPTQLNSLIVVLFAIEGGGEMSMRAAFCILQTNRNKSKEHLSIGVIVRLRSQSFICKIIGRRNQSSWVRRHQTNTRRALLLRSNSVLSEEYFSNCGRDCSIDLKTKQTCASKKRQLLLLLFDILMRK